MLNAQVQDSAGYFLGTNEVLVADDVVTYEEQAVLLRWAEEQLRRGRLLANPRDADVYSTPYLSADGNLTPWTRQGRESREDKALRLVWIPEVTAHFSDPLPEEFWQIRQRVIALLGISELEEDPYKGSFLKYIMSGGEVHEHLDDRLQIDGNEFLLLRCNVLFRRPEYGGMPIINGQEIDIADRGMWAFYPTELLHSATVVGGKVGRGMLSFGFAVHPDRLWQRDFCLAPPPAGSPQGPWRRLGPGRPHRTYASKSRWRQSRRGSD